jgi:polysaccharide pyruvyl transferase WcaK-like protein
VEAARVTIDTSLLNNQGGLRTAGEIESMIAKMDAVITTRLHGTVLAIKNGVPVIPIDPIEGGAKISQQVKALNWPLLFNAASIDPTKLSEAFDYCLTIQARSRAIDCAATCMKRIGEIKENFFRQLTSLPEKNLAYGN